MVTINKKLMVIGSILVMTVLIVWNYLAPERVKVKVAEVTLGDIAETISYSGSIEAARRVKISSEIAGQVIEVLFEELEEVEEGQVLLTLDGTELKAQLTQAQAGLNQAEVNVANARKILRRVEKLFEKGFASQEQLDSAQQAVDVGEALVKQNRSNYEVLRTRLDYTTIKAPLSGTVIDKNVSVGEVVAGPLAGGGIGLPSTIAEIADLTKLEVHVNVDEVDIAKVTVGQVATVAVDAFPDKRYRGVVEEIALMTSSRREMGITYRVKVRIEQPEITLKLGMTATVDFLIGSEQQVLSVPSSAVIAQGDKKAVLVVNTQRMHRRDIVTGREGEELIEVLSGLQRGEYVVTGIVTETDKKQKVFHVGQEGIPDDILKLKEETLVTIVP